MKAIVTVSFLNIALFGAGSFGAGSGVAAPAVQLLDLAHVDLDVRFNEDNTAFEMGFVFEGNIPAPLSLEKTVLVGNELSRLVLDNQLVGFFPWLGNEGDVVYRLPTNPVPGLLYLGMASYTTNFSGILNDQIFLNFIELEGPGDFFLNVAAGDPLMDSSDGAGASQQFELLAGGHEHMNWWFTEPGLYRVHFQAVAELTGEAGGSVASAPTPVKFMMDPFPHQRWLVEQFGFDPVFEGLDVEEIRFNGRPALLDYAFALDPHSASATGLPVLETISVAGQPHLSLIYRKPEGRTDLVYTIERSGDLQAWQALLEGADYSTEAISADSDGTPRCRILLQAPAASGENVFLRVRVSLAL